MDDISFQCEGVVIILHFRAQCEYEADLGAYIWVVGEGTAGNFGVLKVQRDLLQPLLEVTHVLFQPLAGGIIIPLGGLVKLSSDGEVESSVRLAY